MKISAIKVKIQRVVRVGKFVAANPVKTFLMIEEYLDQTEIKTALHHVKEKLHNKISWN